MSSAVAAASDISDLRPGPLLLVSSALLSMPLWISALRETSEFAAAAAPVVGCAVGLVTLYKTRRGQRNGERLKRRFFARLKESTSELLAKPGARSGLLLIVLAVFAAVAHFLPGRRSDVTPLALLSAQPVPARPRRKSDDDAGEDGEADAVDDPAAPSWYRAALALKGTHEGTKRKPNPVVQAMFTDAGHPEIKDTTATPWCAVFVSSVMLRSGYAIGPSMMARSFLNWGEPCKSRLGCVVVMWRGSPDSSSGHVGFLVQETDTHVYVLGGNQSDKVSVARFPRSRVLGYRWPRKPSELRTARRAVTAATAAAGSAVSTAVVIADQLAPVQMPLQQIGTPGAISLAAKVALGCAVVAFVAAVFAAARRIQDYYKDGV